ncbi:MAG: CBS domain-containing protein [Deltaproteobacteria bacterium]|nr:CBS domain-containing protein [Deltaproteobacteria bacterium]
MEIITTHVNADFDAFASMVAAKKLYPDALVVFPGSREKNLRDFFMESTLYILSIERVKDLDFSKVKRLILVDTRQRSRIGRLADLCDSDQVEVHIYDHHPNSDDDVHGAIEIIRRVGATVTIFIDLFRRNKIQVNSEEATVMALGIYEDTGSFTFSSTTPHDLRAAEWLLRRGANLNIVANMMTSDLTKEQIDILHQFIEGSEVFRFGSVEAIIATANAEGYVGDLAILVHKFKEMENYDVVIAIVLMEDRIHLIARSNVPDLNVGEIAAEFGGGGHSTAASATIRDLSIFQVKDRILNALRVRSHSKHKASEIMSRPVITIGPEQTIEEASELLSRYQVSSLPVEKNESLLGILHRSAVDRAKHHVLQDHPVSDFMNPGVVFVTPDESIDQVLRITVDGRHRLVPVIDQGHMVGVISRSDLLEHLKLPRISDSTSPEDFSGGRERRKSVRKLLEERTPKEVFEILRKAGQVAANLNYEVFLVGGAVRDLLLRNYNLDIDLVVEGDGILFSKALADSYENCRVRSHEKFGTAVMLFDNGFKIDVATARHEYYESPGALPQVETSSIKRDLYRRDFTINTLAVCLNPLRWGTLIDFFGGVRDIKERVIRVLHNLAFVEDPTRILRAIRFASRFNLNISKHTLTLIKGALKIRVFEKVEGKRLFNELLHILNERNPLPAIEQMSAIGVLDALCPGLIFNQKIAALVDSVSGVLSWWKYLFLAQKIDPWLVYFLALTDSLDDQSLMNFAENLAVPEPQIKHLIKERRELRWILNLLDREKLIKPSEIFLTLNRLSMESLLFMMGKTSQEQSRKSISEFITRLRHVRPATTGKDLKEMGYEPGPTFGAILNSLRDAQLDGFVRNLEEEKKFLKTFFPLTGRAPSKKETTN